MALSKRRVRPNADLQVQDCREAEDERPARCKCRRWPTWRTRSEEPSGLTKTTSTPPVQIRRARREARLVKDGLGGEHRRAHRGDPVMNSRRARAAPATPYEDEPEGPVGGAPSANAAGRRPGRARACGILKAVTTSKRTSREAAAPASGARARSAPGSAGARQDDGVRELGARHVGRPDPRRVRERARAARAQAAPQRNVSAPGRAATPRMYAGRWPDSCRESESWSSK